MPKAVWDVLILVALFVPFIVAVGAVSTVGAAQTSILQMGWEWQLLLLLALMLPVFALQRLQLLRAPSGTPSAME